MDILTQLGFIGTMTAGSGGGVCLSASDAPLNTVSEPIDDGAAKDDLKKRRKDSVKYNAEKSGMKTKAGRDKKRKQRANARLL